MASGTVMTRTTSPFHGGEQTIQSLAGVRDRMELRRRTVIRDYMPEQHRTFFAALPFMVVGLADQNGHPWATTLSGPPGFMNSAEANLLAIKAWLDPGDPVHSCIRDGAPVGGLGIELSTRRRNRINGRIENCIAGEGFSIRVQQSFGNCPKYIQARNERPRLRTKPEPEFRMASQLDDKEVSFIAGADTFFIASRSAQLDQNDFGTVSTSPIAADVLASYGWFHQPNFAFRISAATCCSTRSAISRWILAPGFCSSTSKADGCCTSSAEPGSTGTFRRRRGPRELKGSSFSTSSAS